jgi:hypothetical protein
MLGLLYTNYVGLVLSNLWINVDALNGQTF